MREEAIRKVVRERYARAAQQSSSCCTPADSCCSGADLSQRSESTGYTKEELEAIPEGANLGLGCGNPVAIASLKEGETVLDLGSGAGIDCFLAAERVGERGKVIGIDMTPEMLAKARANAQKGNYHNVEFRLGEIENLPVADNSVDVIISNCVINLVPDKRRAFSEAFRVLRPGGRMMVSDIVLLKELPEFIKDSIEAYVQCISGALIKDNYMEAIKAAGFQDISIFDEKSFPVESMTCDPTVEAIIDSIGITNEKIREIADSVLSIKVSGTKPN